MTFESASGGGWVLPLAGLERAQLLALLPTRLWRHPQATRFVELCIESAEWWAHCARDAAESTPGDVKSALLGVEADARRMRAGLQPLRHASDAFTALDVNFGYLAMRAREGSVDAEGRPHVPALPSDVPAEAATLLERIERDLKSLETVCAHVAAKIDPPRVAEKHYERALARSLATHHLNCFGSLPPVRQWFGDRFVKRVAEAAGMTIGWRLLSEEVEKLR